MSYVLNFTMSVPCRNKSLPIKGTLNKLDTFFSEILPCLVSNFIELNSVFLCFHIDFLR